MSFLALYTYPCILRQGLIESGSRAGTLHTVHMNGYIGQQCQVPRPFDGSCQGALVSGAGAGTAARLNLASIRNKVAQFIGVSIIDYFVFIGTKCADTALGHVSTFAPSGTSWSV